MKYTTTLIALLGMIFIFGSNPANAQTQTRLVKCPDQSAVFLVNEFHRAKRFTDEQTFYSYGYEFSQVETVACASGFPYAQDGDAINRNGVGFKLIKKIGDPRVFQCAQDKSCKHVTSEQEATRLFGSTWTRQIYETTEVIPEKNKPASVEPVEIPASKSVDVAPTVTIELPKTIVPIVTTPTIIPIISTPAMAINQSHTGRVTDAQTGEPVSGATVVLAYSSVFATSDNGGYYKLPNMDGQIYVAADWYQLSQSKTLEKNDHNDFVIQPIEPGNKIKLVHPTVQWGEKTSSVLSSLSGTITNKSTGELIPAKLVFENRSEPKGSIGMGSYDVTLRTGIYRTYLVTSDPTLQAQLPNERYLFSVPAGHSGIMNFEIELK